MKLPRTLLNKDDTLLEFMRTWWFFTGAGVRIKFFCVPLMIISLSFIFNENPFCLKVSRSLLKNDDTLLEFRRTLAFLTVAGVLDRFLMCSFDDNKLKFIFFKKFCHV